MSIGSPVPLNLRKERLSLAYIRTVAARAGYELSETRIDIDSVDGCLSSTEGTRPKIEFQAKATAQDVLAEGHIAFGLPMKNYEDLRSVTLVPRILVVVVLPNNPEEWLSITECELSLRKCGYWLSLRGHPSVENTSNVTVRLPRSQIFDVDQLSALMLRAGKGPL